MRKLFPFASGAYPLKWAAPDNATLASPYVHVAPQKKTSVLVIPTSHLVCAACNQTSFDCVVIVVPLATEFAFCNRLSVCAGPPQIWRVTHCSIRTHALRWTVHAQSAKQVQGLAVKASNVVQHVC